jgi:hypothetical protein
LRRGDIVGYTLAELALALLFAFIVITLPSRLRVQKTNSELQNKVQNLNAQVALFRQENDDLKRRSITKSPVFPAKTILRSTAPPSCVQIGLTNETLFTMVIRGRDSFEVNQTLYGLSGLLAKFDQDVSAARAAGCFHSIKVLVSPTLGAGDYDFALRQIEQSFYTKKLGLAQ